MDDFTAEMLASQDGSDSQSAASRLQSQVTDDLHYESDTQKEVSSKGLRARVAALRDRASIQDKLLEKLLEQVIPDDGVADSGPLSDTAYPSDLKPRPNFNITTMSNNFRRFNARIGVVFTFQNRVEKLLSWRKTSHTVSFLAVYTFVCLDPYLICILPPVVLLLGVFIPSFLARHPAPPTAAGPGTTMGTATATQYSAAATPEQSMGYYSAKGPPLAPARTVKPVKELSRDFFRNMRDLQNSMDDFSRVHDQVVTLIVPATNFSNEALSSALFLFLTVGCVLMTISAHLLPWRLLFLLGGWGTTCMGHPSIARLVSSAHKQHLEPQEERAKSVFDSWIEKDIILDSAPETREVEIFELQRMSDPEGSGEWEPWLFSPSPYDPLSQGRIAGDRPRGTRFFEDVLPPNGWEWSEKKWALDLWSREWVEERIITGVEVETEGERWVYDIYDEREATKTGVVDAAAAAEQLDKGKGRAMPLPSWEEGIDGVGRRGEWRRRRWVRLVKRKNIAG